MGGLFFHLLPQMFNRMDIGGVRRQLLHRQARCMRLEKVLHGLARMSARAILHHHDVTSRVGQHVAQNGRRALGVQPPLMPVVEKPSGARGDEAKHLVAFARATGGHFGLLACGGPGGAEGAPWGQAGFIATEHQGVALAHVMYNLWPRGPTPFQAFGFLEVSGDNTRLLRGKPQIVEQGGQRMRMLRGTEAVLDEVLNHRRVPTA